MNAVEYDPSKRTADGNLDRRLEDESRCEDAIHRALHEFECELHPANTPDGITMIAKAITPDEHSEKREQACADYIKQVLEHFRCTFVPMMVAHSDTAIPEMQINIMTTW